MEEQLAGQVAAEEGENDEGGSLLQGINDHVKLSGVVEIETGSSEDDGGTDSSDIALATVEIGWAAHALTMQPAVEY